MTEEKQAGKRLRVRNWQKFQHYKDRNPPWIKLHASVLNNRDIMTLPMPLLAQLWLMWLLAAEDNGFLPERVEDARWRLKEESFSYEPFIERGLLIWDDYADDAPWASRYVPDTAREAVMERCGRKCARCGARYKLEIDHINPISQGGDSSIENLQLLCRTCNRKKKVETRNCGKSQAPEHFSLASAPQGAPVCPHEAIVAAYHELLPMCPRVRFWDERRRKYLRGRWLEDPKRQNLEWWRRYFEHVGRSPFLTGRAAAQGDRAPFVADLEWLVRPSNFVKVVEGRYDRSK